MTNIRRDTFIAGVEKGMEIMVTIGRPRKGKSTIMITQVDVSKDQLGFMETVDWLENPHTIIAKCKDVIDALQFELKERSLHMFPSIRTYEPSQSVYTIEKNV